VQFFSSSFTGKEKDEETGYGYFGARYMDHELTTMWLSVDPMADKYPSISPYAYCAWNPVKLVDPDGRKIHLYNDLTVEKVKKYMRE
jgi:RHS repeat-associated protein